MTWAVKYNEAHTASPAMAAKMAGPRPIVPSGYDLYTTAFFQLCTERPVVDGATVSLPISKIVWYAEWNCIDDVHTFCALIQDMDREFIKLIDAARKRREAAQKVK